MGSKNRFSIGLSVIGIFIGIFFYIFRQNYANAQKDFGSQLDSDLNDQSENTLDFGIVSNISGIVNQSKKKYKATFDLKSDGSFQRYLNDSNPFSDPTYKPLDLSPIISNFTYNKSSKFSLRSSAGIAFADMAWAFRDHFNKSNKLYIVSAYRSYGFQNSLLKNGCEKKRCAEPGSSEHQAGLAVDISVASKNGKTIQMTTGSDYYNRMDQNAYKYGFHNTYKKGVEIDGKMAEHRHRRFVGIPFATYLHDNDLTIAEYFIMHAVEYKI
ncbi:MAG: D-alanyl-D-alanine carboxypeptidase family protein [Candidatus Absconditicoccaceae bacterium]